VLLRVSVGVLHVFGGFVWPFPWLW